MNTNLPKTLFPFFWHFLKQHWVLFLFVQFFSLGWAIDHTMWPVVFMMFIDGITNFVGDRSTMWHVLATPIIFAISLWILVELFFRLAGILSSFLIPKVEGTVRLEMFNYVQYHSYSYFSNHMAGSIANKISDMPLSMTRIFELVVYLFIPVVVALLIALILFAQINILFAAILGGWLVVHIGISIYFARFCDHASHVHSESRSVLVGKVVDSLSNSLNVRLFARYQFERHYLKRYQKDEQKKHFNSMIIIEKMKAALGVSSFLGVCIGLYGYMLYSWQQGMIDTGEVVFIFNTTWNITMMAWLAGLEFPTLFKEIGICKQALTVIQEAHDIRDIPNALPLRVTKGEIKFDDVTFRYQKNVNLFQNKNITIHAGQKVGLVGYSGSGKTTFINLILRYFEVDKGQILIDGQDISKVTQDSLRLQLTNIPQDPILFHRSLIDNIRYGKLDASDDEVIEASKQANCHEFIMKMPEQYNSLVGERGIKLSGGQRQRIAIARAILKNTQILILDEATSALDSVTERDIQNSLHFLTTGKTTLVIAHRLSTLSGMDRILVFSAGKIIEDGTHQELLDAGGHYAKMWDMQAGGFLLDDPYAEEDDED